MSKLKIGIIGCGGIANQKHFPALTLQKDKAEMVAFCDIEVERAKEACEKYGVEGAKYYEDYNELLADPLINVVHICTPNVSHSPIAVAAFEAGKNVLCEKPMAHNTEAAQKMMDAWKKSGKKFTIGYQNRFREEVRSLHETCEQGELGEIYFAKAHALRRKAVPTWGVFPDKSQQGGGPLIDIGTHALDITLWMMDNYEPESVNGSVFHKLGSLPGADEGNMFGPWDTENFEVEDSAFGFVKMKNGATIFLESSWALNILESKEAATTLCGTKAGAQINAGMSYQTNELIINKACNGLLTQEELSASGNIAYFEGGSNAPEVLEAKQWLEAVANDTDPLVKPEQAFVVTQILDSIYKSAELGKEVKIG
ncbi:Gfo/Idh/MocA family oxidoreductase [Enterococcus hulanensis]|uniref:Gfo/Idh/MocA family protein n=1 Tax=Enterococcus hulanensis TaxID=2559929 RepID=UPI001A8E983C|nr:Gfo/Idh/MocA family oxidoreductase [Enterococcus hulanensis]MBO0458232.1 Gfo/Idh/MocA family oxidoreductase [Enterococcus hulanensis]